MTSPEMYLASLENCNIYLYISERIQLLALNINFSSNETRPIDTPKLYAWNRAQLKGKGTANNKLQYFRGQWIRINQ